MLNNSVEAVGALLEQGARWEVVDMSSVHARLRETIEQHPAVRRKQLVAVAGLDGEASQDSARRTPKF